MSKYSSSIWPGLLFIIIGALLLAHNLVPYSFGWYEIYPLILIALGILIFGTAFGKQDKGAVFPGTILFLLGLFFLIRNYDLIPYRYMHPVWPYILIIIGLAFFAIFLTRPSDWGALIPAGILLFWGVIVLLKRLDILYWDLWEIGADYWPVVLIIIGVGIILGSLRRRQISIEKK